MKKIIVAVMVCGFWLGLTGAAEAATLNQLRAEAARISAPPNSWRYLPGDECSRWTRIGMGKADKTNGRDVWSVRSRLKPTVWFTYRVAPAVGLDNEGRCHP